MEFFKNSESQRNHWDFGKHNIPIRPDSYMFIEAPENSSPTVKKVWKQRGYGLWPSNFMIDILRDLKLDFELTQDQRDLFKSHIATNLITDDAENFEKLGDKNHFKASYLELVADNTKRLKERQEKVEKDIIGRVGASTGADTFALIEDIMSTRVSSFVSACKRTGRDQERIDLLIKDQVFILVRDIDVVNKGLPRASGIMGLESITAPSSL